MFRHKFGILIIESALLLSVFCTEARAQIDSLQLDSTVLSAAAKRPLLDIGRAGVATVDMSELALMPSILGNSDPLHFVQMLPSMQTSSEYDAGIHIQGCDHQHNLVALDGVPIYGATHLMGLFSVFNPTHYRSMSYSTVASGVNRLGGVIDMHTRRTRPERVGLDASLGLVSAQATLEAPLGPKAALILSGRGSLVDLLYGNYLTMDDISLSYGFSDLNATWIWNPTKSDRIAVDLYYGYDRARTNPGSTETSQYGMDLSIDLFWHNGAAAIHWNRPEFEQTLYYSGFALDVDLVQQTRKVLMPSSISTVGYKAGWSHGQLSLKADVAMHEIVPQNPQLLGTGLEYEEQELQRAFENTLTAGWNGTLGYDFEYSATLAGHWYISPEKRSYFGLSPQLSGTYHLGRRDQIRLKAGVYRQYLFQTGLSNLGLPIEFWLPAGKYGDPQWSVGGSLGWDKPLAEGLELNAEIYYRYLGNQLEYVCGLQDILAGTYSLDRALVRGRGHAYGLNLLLRKQQGKLTGWAGLSAGRSLRSFDGSTWPSNHERLVEFDMVASYQLGRWDFGGTLVAATGTPFTEVKEYYLIHHQIVSVMGPYNGARLKPYYRLDLNARLRFNSRGRVQHGLNFSVYNVTARKQEIFRRVHSERDNYKIEFESMYLGITILPSVGYYLKF